MALACTVACFNGTVSFAFDNGYNSAATYTNTVSSRITSASQVDWYKFEVTADEVPTSYSVTLKVPTDCMYNFDVRFRAANSTGRPIVLDNETIVSGTRRRTGRGMLREPGTYYVRVYSQNGTVDGDENYNLTLSYEKNGTCSVSYPYSGRNIPVAESTDWSVCADMLGNYTFNRTFPSASSGRNYMNAYTFMTTNYESDNQSGYANKKKMTPQQTAIAADYIFSGDLMQNPKFKVEENKIYTIDELMYYLYVLDEPIIFYLANAEIPANAYKKYVILKDVNIGINEITYVNPSDGKETTIDYNEFLDEGFEYSDEMVQYTGTNIINANTPRRFQAIYN